MGISWLTSQHNSSQLEGYFLDFQLAKLYGSQGVRSAKLATASFQSFNKIPETPGIVIQTFLHELQSVFAEPMSLPGSRNTRTHLSLLPISKPPNSMPYCYPHSENIEIENQVVALLKYGFIRLISSPFASSVLLVKNKDDTWRLCVDSRSLNKITISEKYSIPNIDELLDELRGPTIFSKIAFIQGTTKFVPNRPISMKQLSGLTSGIMNLS